MKRYLCIIGVILILFPLCASEHPRIYVSDSERELVKEKIAHQPWAKNVYLQLKDKIDPYVKRHQMNPEWIVSRLAMYWKEGERYTQCYLKKQNWDRGEGNAPVPTVRMPGMRTWNKYVNVPLEERTPYNESGDMWGLSRTEPDAPKVLVPYKESGHMIRANNVEILTLAEEAAFLYWLTEEEEYARFATDIFYTWLLGTYYMNPILDPELSTGGKGGYEPGGICGYYDYEQIHDDLAMHAAVIYDFAYNYMMEHPHPHLKELSKTLPEVAGVVFKRFIDIGFVRGGKSGNWNVNGWNIMLRPILALEDNDAYADGKGRSYYLHYLTDESTSYHDAIPDILKGYNPTTGLWPESPGYAFGVTNMLLDFATLLRKQGIDIIAQNPGLQKSALAVFPWMDANANMIVFGDSRGGAANFRTFENLLAYYAETQDEEGLSHVASALNTGIESGKYNRGNQDWTALCSFVPEIPTVEKSTKERTSYSPFHRLVTLRNELKEGELMAVLYGGRKGSHLSPNGLALQLYGFGYALAPDASGYESYWSKDYSYHQSATGSNTILPGYAEGEIKVHLMEPSVDSLSFVNQTALNPFINIADVEAGEKRRLAALVKTGQDKGYYVDIFRSDLADNDYLFHNVGTSLQLKNAAGISLPMEPVSVWDKKYAIGYDWFKNIRRASYSDDFKAIWNVNDSLSMNMWMAGGRGRELYVVGRGRELYVVEAPYTTLLKGLTPNNVSVAPSFTPTLIVRQEGTNAWSSPFVAVFEAAKGAAQVRDIKCLDVNKEKVILNISSENGREDYLFSAIDSSVSFQTTRDIRFQGSFGLATERDGKMEQLYMVNAYLLETPEITMKSETPVSASVYRKDGEWRYSSTAPITIVIRDKTYRLKSGYDLTFK